MYKYLVILILPLIFSCNQNNDSLKQKELALKEKELQLKEREMNDEILKKQTQQEEVQKNPQLNTARDRSSININGTYSGLIKDGTSWFVSINSFDGKNFSGYNIIYWENHPEGYKTYFTGSFNNDFYSITMSEDKNIKGSGLFTGSVSSDGRNMNGEWRRYTDNGLFLWSLTKVNDEN